MQALEGQTIEHFHILRRIARGGMSDIYLAQDTLSNDQVVVKIVHNSNREYCARFRGEVQAIASLKHEHILPALAYGEHEDWCYMVAPYIKDGTLNDHLAQGSLSLNETDQILTQIASALQFAHDSGIIHRDIKPSNILLHDKKHVLLADFGLAKHLNRDDNLTVTGYLIGTPEYMAPELAEKQATVKSDIYALGVVIYQLLTGKVPFKGSTPMGTYLKHIRERPLPLTTLNPKIPEAVQEVILRSLEKNPGHRFDSVLDLANAYHAALAQHEKQASQIAPSLWNKDLSAMTSLKLPAFSRTNRSLLLGLVAIFCLVFIPTSLGFAFYNNTNHHMLAPIQLQGVGMPIPSIQSTRKAANIIPTPTLRRASSLQKPIMIQITQNSNENIDNESQENAPTNVENNGGNQNNGGGQGNNNHGKGHGDGGGHKKKSGSMSHYTKSVAIFQTGM